MIESEEHDYDKEDLKEIVKKLNRRLDMLQTTVQAMLIHERDRVRERLARKPRREKQYDPWDFDEED